MHPNLPVATRRALLLGSGAAFACAYAPRIAHAQGRDPRFLAIVLRGGLDGLAVVAPVGDPDWRKLRGDKALTLDGQNAALPLDDFFALNPAMPNLHRLYRAGQALFVHAVATPYRERSHFDGQDVLQSGFAGPGVTDTGWLNRALSANRSDAARGRQAFAIGPITPLIMRGPSPVLSWMPPRLPPVGDDTVMRLLDLYRHTDPVFAGVIEERIGIAAIAHAGGMDVKPADGSPAVQTGGIAQVRTYFAHAAGLLGALDGALAAVETGMGEVWRDTVVALVTEFGRTAQINGNDGTDHGTATAAQFAGGALKGGRVIADWPGLKEADLYEKRDLKPTTDLRAVLKGLLRDHLRVDERHLETAVFPDSTAARPTEGLLA
jgi:uncharacterized protein (DUF1501 family)